MAFRVVICAAVLFVSAVSVNGYATGAPPQACNTLTPKHGPTTPQNGAPPFDFSVSKTTVNAGDRVTVTLSRSGNGPSFKGFLLQARKSGGSTAVGKWTPVSGISKGLKCDDQDNSSLTHVNNDEKEQVTGEWVAPARGTYEIFYTVAENGGTYWVGQKSRTITVS